MKPTPQPDLPAVREPMAVARPAASALSILESAIAGGVTKENVEVVKELIAMRREELAEQAKADFANAFFKLRQAISTMDIYADKAAKTDSGAVAYRYCSEQEISRVLEPLLFRHEFVMLFGQKQENDRINVSVTLIHGGGHQETREYAVRAGATNRMKDATAADAGAGTTAWRHLMVKMFGLKSRISEDADARNEGGPIRKLCGRATNVTDAIDLCCISIIIIF